MTQPDPPYVCTPWSHNSALLELRDQLYGSDYQRRRQDDDDQDGRKDTLRAGQKDAIQRVQAWEERGELPLVINSTVLLVEAQVADEERSRDGELGRRMGYSVAILRFVTGICDAMQDTKLGKQSMLQIAVLLQLPAELVEARHAISHKDLPSLSQLRLAAQLGLKWLWNWYWAKLDDILKPDDVVPPTSEEDKRTMGTKMHAVLKKYLSDRRTEVKRKAKELKAAKVACSALAEIASDEEVNRDVPQKVLLGLLVDEKMVIPSDKKLGSSMNGAFLLWDDLLQRLSSFQKDFLQAFVGRLQSSLNAPAKGSVAQDPVREAVSEWIVRILTSPTWAATRERYPEDLKQTVMENCFVAPGPWMLALAKALVKHSDKKFKVDWSPFLDEDAEGAHTSEGSAKVKETEQVVHSEEEDFEMKVEDSALRQCAPGWGVWNGYWERSPIGGAV